MRLLDLCCGAGGCSAGYARAGFDVTGVDHVHHDGYPDSSLSLIPHSLDVECEFVQADVLDVIRDLPYLRSFDAVAASPPCPGYSNITADPDRHPRLILPIREACQAAGVPYVIENVWPGAAVDMLNPVLYCGSSFGLKVRRHRLFDSDIPIVAPPCAHDRQGEPIGVYGHHPETGGGRFPRPTDSPSGAAGTSRGVRASSLAEGREAMGIPWMTRAELKEAIPPAYTEYIGFALRSYLTMAVAA